MPLLLADENFNEAIPTGVLRRMPALSLVTVSESGLLGATDPELLDWATVNNRVVVTHDKQPMLGHALRRVRAGRPMPGELLVHQWCDVASAIEDVASTGWCVEPGEIDRQIWYVLL